MSSSLRHALVSFKEQLERRQQDRRTDRIAKTRAEQEMEPLPPVPLAASGDVRAFFGRVKTTVDADCGRYLQETVVNAEEVQGKEAAETPVAANIHVAPGVHVQAIWEQWSRCEALVPNTFDPTAGAPNLCAALLMSEIAYLMQENSQKPIMPGGMLMKVRQSVQAFLDGRTNDTVTLLKNVLHNDPHNHSVLMILSQVLYYLAARGTNNVLPEARDFAQRSTIYSDKLRPSQLALYRYLALATERGFGPERTMEWLRDTGMLQVGTMAESNDGIMVERGIGLRCWYLLSTIPVELWQDSELLAIKDLVTKVIGGAAVYMAWIRGPLLAAASLSKTPLPHIDEIEELLQSALVSFNENANAMRQMPLTSSDKPWMLRVRFLNAVVQVAPVPQFDQAMLQVALDGKGWNEGNSPDPELRATLGLREVSYWRLWALVLTPFKDVRQPYLLPAEETLNDSDMLAACDQLLMTLGNSEKALIKAHLWEDLKPWMVRWQLDHLLAASTGSNKPRSRFAPSLPPYTSLYRIWQEPPISALLPSEIIVENARRGAFASLFEIQAAIEGAMKLIADPVHGLVASQKRALTAANRYNPKKFGSVSTEFGSSGGSGIIMLLMPVGVLGLVAAVVTFSANWGQALGLILALGGIAGVIALNVKK